MSHSRAAVARSPRSSSSRTTATSPRGTRRSGRASASATSAASPQEEWQSKMNPQDFGYGAWWINASGGRVGTTKIKVGDVLRVVNEGGEAHTFTQDESYGVVD